MYRYTIQERTPFLGTWIDLEFVETLDEAFEFHDEWIDSIEHSYPEIRHDVRISTIDRSQDYERLRSQGEAL